MNRIVRSFVTASSQALYIRRTTGGGIDRPKAEGKGQRAKGKGQRAEGRAAISPLPSALCQKPGMPIRVEGRTVPVATAEAAAAAGVAVGVDDDGALIPVPPGPASCSSS